MRRVSISCFCSLSSAVFSVLQVSISNCLSWIAWCLLAPILQGIRPAYFHLVWVCWVVQWKKLKFLPRGQGWVISLSPINPTCCSSHPILNKKVSICDRFEEKSPSRINSWFESSKDIRSYSRGAKNDTIGFYESMPIYNYRECSELVPIVPRPFYENSGS